MARDHQVLLIEDNDVDAAVFARSVEVMPGWQVTRVRSLEEAEEVVEQRGAAWFDLVAVDLTLPDAVDLEAVRFARSAIPRAVCVAVTARDPGEVDERALRAGAADLLVKGQMNARGIQRAVTHAVERNELVRRQLESERNLRSMLSAWRDALLVVDDARRVLFRNEAAAVLGEALVQGEGDAARLGLELRPGEVLQTELRLRNGDALPIEARSWSITWAAEPARVVVVRDRREERAAELARAEAEAHRDARRGLHDIGNAAVSLDVEVAALEHLGGDDDALAAHVASLRRLTDQVIHLVRVSRGDAGRERRARVPLDLCAVVRSATATSRPALDAVGGLRLQLDPLVEIRGDAPELVRVVDNLVRNAVEALATVDRPDREIRVSVRHEGDRAVLEVADNGPGIPPDALPRVFDEGFTAGKPHGTGIGLANVRRIVDDHGGRVEVESALGRGAVFRVVLPATRTRRGLHLLLVEDQPEVARAIERLLAAHHRVDVVHDGAAALERLRDGTPPDVVLCDLEMPGMDGRALFDRLRAERPALADRVVFCTGGATTDATDHFLATAGRPILHKPLDAAEALRTIDEVAEG